MATTKQLADLEARLKEYRRKYIRQEYSNVDESATRLMVNHLLNSVLGYEELEDVKTEYQIRGAYADYVIQLKRKKYFVVEVKSIQLDLSDKHLRQSVGYAANEGIDWILLTNGRQLQCYHIQFSKPILPQLFFSIDFSNQKEVKTLLPKLYLLTKRSILSGDIDTYWHKYTSLTPEAIAQLLYSDYVARYLRRSLNKSSGVYFTLEEVTAALGATIQTEIKSKLRFKNE